MGRYDGFKSWCKSREILADGVGMHLIASLTGGFMATALSCPADVVMTVWTTSPQTTSKPATLFGCVAEITREGGIAALYRCGSVTANLCLSPNL